MAQTVKLPRFYINELEWLDYNNVLPLPSEHFRTLPVTPKAFEEADFYLPYDLTNPYCAILGHSDISSIDFETATVTGTQINESPSSNGWSLMELDGKPTKITAGGNISSILIGSHWSPPFSPDLSVKLSYDYSGVKHIQTKGGSRLSNSFYDGNPKWGQLGAWELQRAAQASEKQFLSKSGRRIWDISFSFLSESDIFPGSLNLATEADENYTDDTLLTGTDDFYGQVVHRTAGHLPFLFSPDSTSTSLDNFAICTFEQKAFSFQQTSPGLYSTKMKVVETW